MKKLILFLLFINVNIFAADLISDNAKSALTELAKEIKSGENENAKNTFTLPAQRYEISQNSATLHILYISNHDQDNPKRVGLYLENIRNVIIDLQGADLVFNGRMLPIALVNCENVTLKNFSIDFEPTHLRQIKVIAIDAEKNYADYEFEPHGEYKIENEKLVFFGDDFRYEPRVALAFREDKRMTYQRRDLPFHGKVKDLGEYKIRVYGFDEKNTTVGERYVLRSWERPAPAIFITDAKNIQLENVTVHYAEGMGLLAQMTENITLEKFSVCLRENDARYYTTQADATHFSSCKGKIISTSGLYENMADDAINVHGTYLKIIKRVDDYTFHAEYMHKQTWGFNWGFAGDEIQFIAAKKMETIGAVNRIKEIKAVDQLITHGAKIFRIVLENSLPPEINENENFGVENLTWTPEVYFAKNTVRNNRARGALFSTPKRVVCEENHFDHTHGCAILLCGDCQGWYETGACRAVIIRKNVFRNALTANYQFTKAIISIYPEILNLSAQKKYFHQNIVIEDNHFDTFDRPLLYAKSVDGLHFRHNTITQNNDFPPFHENKFLFWFQRVNNVVIANNKFPQPFNAATDLRVDFSENAIIEIGTNDVAD